MPVNHLPLGGAGGLPVLILYQHRVASPAKAQLPAGPVAEHDDAPPHLLQGREPHLEEERVLRRLCELMDQGVDAAGGGPTAGLVLDAREHDLARVRPQEGAASRERPLQRGGASDAAVAEGAVVPRAQVQEAHAHAQLRGDVHRLAPGRGDDGSQVPGPDGVTAGVVGPGQRHLGQRHAVGQPRHPVAWAPVRGGVRQRQPHACCGHGLRGTSSDCRGGRRPGEPCLGPK
mmetsp:Transcript_58614/g.182036  ORF Transcript_58614/g.182036 Transcript_58614/m.182036 type:complete len:231 (-) Transcript_58614:2-694(-)